MALPKLNTPVYTLELPSTGTELKYRPFLVKEEKILLIAMESEDEKQINESVMQIVKECTFGEVGDPDTPLFDLEYVFLRIRSKSVGEKVDISVLCPDDEKTRVDVKLDLEDVNVQMTSEHTNIIELTDNISLVMKYPTISSTIGYDDISDTERVFRMMENCVHEIHDGETVHNIVDVSTKEMEEFFESMTQEMFVKVQEFFNTMPKLRHVIQVKNPKTKKKNEVVLEGLQAFFG
tara:strand:+ start:160 stop:864 length:705 start_codon:yes stop_codon:yes gene_type:complete